MIDIAPFTHTLDKGGIRWDTSDAELTRAAKDASQLRSAPVCVVYPASTEQVSQIVVLCCEHGLPVSVAGGYTGLSGGVLGYDAVRIETLQMNSFSIEGDVVHAEPGASVPEIMRACAEQGFVFPFQPASACRAEDVYEYLGTRVGPVTVGGSIGANASGLVGCKLGAAADWLRKLTVVLPSGDVQDVTDRFDRYAGTEGRYGIITHAEIRLSPALKDIHTYLVSGTGVEAFTSAAAAIGSSGELPLLAEAMVMGVDPPDFEALVRRTFDEPDVFWDKFGPVFRPGNWLVLLQGSEDEVCVCLEAIEARDADAHAEALTDDEFLQVKQVRSAASDEIGSGVANPNPLKDAPPPVTRASQFLAEAIAKFMARGIRPKAEHNYGLLWVFLVDGETREQYAADVRNAQAFDDGSLAVYDECNGNLAAFLERFLAPRITENMVNTRTAVNFPGNEDILIPVEQFGATIELLDRLMHKYGACPVPLYYCHINFRKQPGWVLLHNRLLIDVTEFGEQGPED